MLIPTLYLVASGCQKESLEDFEENKLVEPGSPDFFLEGYLNGKRVKWVAGEDSFFMFANHEKLPGLGRSDSFPGKHGLNLQGHLSKEEGENPKDRSESILFSFLYSPSYLSMEKATLLTTGEYGFVNEGDQTHGQYYVLRLAPIVSGKGSFSYVWKVGEGDPVFEKYVEAPLKYDPEEIFDISLSVSNDKGRSHTITNSFAGVGLESMLSFTFFNDPFTQSLVFKPVLGERFETLMVKWEADSTSNGVFQQGPDRFSLEGYRGGAFKVTMLVTVLDKWDNEVKTLKRESVINLNSIVDSDGDFGLDMATGLDSVPVGQSHGPMVGITYIDDFGVEYSLDEMTPYGTSFFEVLESEPYNHTKDGVPTRRLKVRFSCRLTSDNKVLELRDFEGFIAIGHP